MQISFNCTQKPSFSKKKSVFMGEEQVAVAPKATKSDSVAQPATQPTVPAAPTAQGPVLQPQPQQDAFKKVECKDCK